MVYINELENPQPHILLAIRWEQGTIFARPARVKDSTREGGSMKKWEASLH